MNKDQLVEELLSYIDLLNKEIDDLIGIAYVHGWQSRNVELGKQARERIKELGINLNERKTTIS